MMVAVFTSMLVALGAAQWGPRWLAVTALLVCLALATGEFLWEIYSPVDGFRLPWLQASHQGAMVHSGLVSAGRPA